MNSLNILSARVIGQTLPQTPDQPSRSRSFSESVSSKGSSISPPRRSASQHEKASLLAAAEKFGGFGDGKREDDNTSEPLDEKTPLLDDPTPELSPKLKKSRLRLVAKRLVDALTESLKWVLSTLVSPGVYVVTCFYDDEGRFSPLMPIRKMKRRMPKRNGSSSTAHAIGLSGSLDHSERSTASETEKRKTRQRAPERRVDRIGDSASSATSESDIDIGEKENSSTRPKVQSSSSVNEVTPARRSIRIKLKHEDSSRLKRQKKVEAKSTNTTDTEQPPVTAANLKSPTSPAASLRMTKYPRAPAPPRPLIPRRQPSYSNRTSHRSSALSQKTLVIDLDETLIHSLAKGGRMSSGHMVEVKLNTAVGFNGTTLGPQHPILYYVHKRPHCDDFLRNVSKWYNLVAFTASVQEYADPVIDWLEQERKYFSARYYRQHCTLRNGAYIKDLSSVEPDLSKVMILDNSPLSYIFHEGIPSLPPLPSSSAAVLK